MNLLLRRTALVLLLVVVTVGGLAAAYRLHPKVRKKTNDIVYVIQHPNASYDERMTWQMGNEYRLYKLVTANTPPDAVILLAPAPDASLRSRGRMGYFLYPRTLVPATEWNSFGLTHALVIRGCIDRDILEQQSIVTLDESAWGIVDLISGNVLLLGGDTAP